MSELTKDQKSLLLYFETCLVDNHGMVDSAKMNDDDHKIVADWQMKGYVQFARFPAKWLMERKNMMHGTAHQVRLSAEAMTDAHRLRAERAARMISEEKQRELLKDHYEQAMKMLNRSAKLGRA
ncbi:MAG: hypothetical protein Q8K86_10775 [Candidatus Nanopelagicaceae bacterium]|nr:hypothetical protein [Candidatus Nanopelagicaceae bacterium]